MYLVVTSAEDAASMNIRERLLEMADWEEVGSFDGSPVLSCGQYTMVLIQKIHLEAEGLDSDVEDELGIRPECMIFASRHKSESGLRTLSVHPIGNYGEAKFGGRPRTLVPSAPKAMTLALLLLKRFACNLDFQISYECTHHGPCLGTPTFFIEIGSDRTAWPEPEPAKAIAQVVLELDSAVDTEGDWIAIGVGGGHYAPRHTDLVEKRRISLGHMLPSYALGSVDDIIIDRVIEATPGCSGVYFHKKGMKKSEYRRFREAFEAHGLPALESSDIQERMPVSEQ
jgi:D-aminoacyl-tRNA deacylase